MKNEKIDCQERIQQNHGLIDDLAFHSLQCFGSQQNWNMGIHVQPHSMEAGSQQQNLRSDKSSSSIMSRFESPASAFYATERYMGFPQYNCQVGSPSCSQYFNSCDSQIPSHHSSGENYSIDPGEEADQQFELRRALHSFVQPHFRGNHQYKSFEKPYKGLRSSSSGNKLHPHEQHKLLGNDAISVGSHFSVPFQGNQDCRVCIFHSTI